MILARRLFGPPSQNGSEPMVKRLLDAGANPNLALLSGETPLMVASRTGSAPVAELLLAKGADINATGTRKQTALMWAVAQKHPEVVKVLLAHGANVHARSAPPGPTLKRFRRTATCPTTRLSRMGTTRP